MICRIDPLLDNLMIMVQEEERESLRDQILCYLIHIAAEHLSQYVLDFIDEAIVDGLVDVSTHVANKLLICSIIINDRRVFHTTALDYLSEPPTKLFSVLNRVLDSCSTPSEYFELGFTALLKKLSRSARLPDVLLAMETPEHAKSNPHGLVASFIDSHFHAIERHYVGPGAGLLGFQEAGVVIRICACYQDGFDRADQ